MQKQNRLYDWVARVCLRQIVVFSGSLWFIVLIKENSLDILNYFDDVQDYLYMVGNLKLTV